MDKERINREAMQFQQENCCFIHAECKNGEYEAIVTGDGVKVITALSVIIGQIAKANQSSFEKVLEMLIMTHKLREDEEIMGKSKMEATAFSFPKMPKKEDEDS